MIGNGQAGAIPFSELTDEARAERNVVYIGVPTGKRHQHPLRGLRRVFRLVMDHKAPARTPQRERRFYGVLHATKGQERLLFRYQPFASRFNAPDYFTGAAENRAGFFDYNGSLAKTLTLRKLAVHISFSAVSRRLR